MATEILTKEDLDQFKRELLNEIKTIVDKPRTLGEEWIKSTSLRKELPLSPGTLQNLRVNGTLAYSRLGGIIFYNVDSIRLALKKGLIDNSLLGTKGFRGTAV